MRQATSILSIRTSRPGLLEITDQIREWTGAQGFRTGLLTIFCRHTSASLLIQENAAKPVRDDLEAFFARIAPEDGTSYSQEGWGPEDIPAQLGTAPSQVQ